MYDHSESGWLCLQKHQTKYEILWIAWNDKIYSESIPAVKLTAASFSYDNVSEYSYKILSFVS